MYRMEAGGQRKLYTVRMRKTDDGWKYDWFGNATEEQIKSMAKGRRLPSESNGKWYVVQADKHEEPNPCREPALSAGVFTAVR